MTFRISRLKTFLSTKREMFGGTSSSPNIEMTVNRHRSSFSIVSTPLSFCTPLARPESQRHRPHRRRISNARVRHRQVRSRSSFRSRRRVLHGRSRVDHRAQLRTLRVLFSTGATVMFEGTPTYPDAGVWWRIVEDRSVSVFYTSPTALNVLRSFGEEFVKQKRSFVSRRARHRGRTDFIRNVAVVSTRRRRREIAHRRHVVANRNRRSHDRASSRGDAVKTVERYVSVLGVVPCFWAPRAAKPSKAKGRGVYALRLHRGPECFTTSSARTNAT